MRSTNTDGVVTFLFIAIFLAVSLHSSGQKLGLSIYNETVLKSYKNEFQSSKSEYKRAFKKILKEADQISTSNIKTVVDKKQTPPSGNKHDYMSLAPYWWPDSTKADGLPYIRRDGRTNPQVKEFDREPLSKMFSSVKTLTLTYYLTDDDKYAKIAVEIINKWYLDPATKMNPNFDFGQVVLTTKQMTGRGAGMIDAYGFVDFFDNVKILRTSKSFTKDIDKQLVDWFKGYAAWVESSPITMEQEDKAPNNHGTALDVQRTALYLFLGDTAKAVKLIQTFPEKRLFKQIEPDGRQPLELQRTMALHYSLFNLTHILDMCDMASRLGVDLYSVKSQDGRTIAQAVDYVAQYLGKPLSEWPYQQIKNWDEKQKQLARMLLRVNSKDKSKGYKQRAISYLGKEQYEVISTSNF